MKMGKIALCSVENISLLQGHDPVHTVLYYVPL
jgi:hypothetical protein